MTRTLKFALPAVALALPLLTASPAHAGIDACGDVHVEANAQCELLVEAECQAACEPVAFEASCAADLQAMCDGQCTAMLDVACTETCNTTCLDVCTVDPGKFDCRAECNADCQGSCDGACIAADNKGECRASCEATCAADCQADCEAVPPMATCDEQCGACCTGSCEAIANLDCQVTCQATGYADCKADLQGGCEAECSKPEGALFCDGQYIDHGGNLEECVNSLKELLNIEVSGYAEGMCANGKCEGEAGGEVSCGLTVAPESRLGGAGFMAGLLGLGLFAAGRRRRRA